MNKLFTYFIALILVLAFSSCNSTKHVPDGKYLLDNVHIKIQGEKKITSTELINYLRQQPNNKVLGCMKIQLATYNLSGKDTTKWFNKWMRRLGQAPVIYDSTLADISAKQLRQALINKGYNDAVVISETYFREKKKKANITYFVNTGEQHFISDIKYNFEDSVLGGIVMKDSVNFTIAKGSPFDRNALEAERNAITERLRRNGYYSFTKDYITFIADTAANQKDVELTMVIRKQEIKVPGAENIVKNHEIYYIRNVYIVTDYNTGDVASTSINANNDTILENDIYYIVRINTSVHL